MKSNSPLRILSDHTGLLLVSAGYFYRDLDRDWARIAKKNRAKKLSSCFMSPDFAFEVESDLMDRVCDVAKPSQEFLCSLKAVNTRMAANIRLGDFEVTNPRVRDEMLGYVPQAAIWVKRLNPDGLVVDPFGDQPVRVWEILRLSLSETVDVRVPPTALRPKEELNLIGRAGGFIGSASTNSWGGRISPSKKGIPRSNFSSFGANC